MDTRTAAALPRRVVDEIEWAIDRYSPEMLWIADDVFTIHHGWLAEYAAEMKRRNIRIPFECITRADRMNEKVAALLAELSCMRVWIGSESGSQRILDAMERGVTVEQVQKAVALAKHNGIQTGMFLMWGYEGEDISDIEATVEHVKKCRPDVFFTTISYPIKGTPYFEKVSQQLVSIRPWAQSTDRDFALSGRHSRTFYRHADELLRSEMAAEPDAAAIQAARQCASARQSRGGGMSASLVSPSDHAAAYFDQLAPRYDAVWTNSPAGRLQREAVWRHRRSADPARGSGSRHRMWNGRRRAASRGPWSAGTRAGRLSRNGSGRAW